MIRRSVALIVLWHASVYACDTAEDRLTIAQQLRGDQEFSNFICGNDSCDEASVLSRIEIRAQTVNRKKRVQICVVEPTRKARNMYIGVFLKKYQEPAQLELMFFGSYIQATGKMVRGYRTLEGREYLEANEFAYYTYEWNGVMYTESGANALPPK